MDRAKGTDRLLDILAYFEGRQDPVSRNALAIALDCPRSTVYMLVDQLVERGWLQQLANGNISLGYRAGLIGLAYAGHEEFEKSARLAVGKLAEELGEVIDLDIIDKWQQLVVVSANGRGKTYLNVVEGSRYPLPLTASSRILLDGIPSSVLESCIPPEDFVAGDGSVLKLSDFVSDIQQARELGYGLVEGSMDPMVGAVSVPVRNPSGHCLAALSVVLPSALIKADLQALLQPLQRTASELQSQLRLRDWPLGEAGFASLRMAR